MTQNVYIDEESGMEMRCTFIKAANRLEISTYSPTDDERKIFLEPEDVKALIKDLKSISVEFGPF